MQSLTIDLCSDSNCNLITKQAHVNQNILHTLGIKDFSKLVGAEFLTDVDDKLMMSTIVVKKDLYAEMFKGETTKITFPKDGVFHYYKLLIPKLSYFHSGFISPDETQPHKQLAKYYVPEGEVFFWENTFRIADITITGIESEVIKNTSIISLDEIWGKHPSSIVSFQKPVFSFCKLQKCLVNLQKQILKGSNNCDSCEKLYGKTYIQYTRDLLLNSIYVLEYLTQNGRYEEAQDIVDRLSDCSGTICDNSELKSNCNCGKAI